MSQTKISLGKKILSEKNSLKKKKLLEKKMMTKTLFVKKKKKKKKEEKEKNCWMSCSNSDNILQDQDVISDKVCMYEEMMTNTDNLESYLPTSNLLKICSFVQVEFYYKLHMLSCRDRVPSSMKCVVQVKSK